jgi:carbon-monoxide dehydrogenase large subunit
MGFGIGQSVLRKEDLRLLTGVGEFSDDINLPNQAYAAFVRSPHAHADVLSISSEAAEQAPGVLAVLTGEDFLAQGLSSIPRQPFPPDLPLTNSDGTPCFVPPDYPIVIDRVRHVGEAVAMVVATSRAEALAAAELVEVEYNPLTAVVNPQDALAPDAPVLWQDRPDNLCIDGERGDRAATDEIFKRAAHVVDMKFYNNRVTGLPLEPAAAVADFDPQSGHLTLHAGGQGVLIQKNALCKVFGIADDSVRVICRDVGGGFGTKNVLYREYALIAWASRVVKRPVKWRGERSEAFMFDPYGRDLTSTAELALDDDGRFLALRIHSILNTGSQVLMLMPLVRGASVANGVYDIPAMYVSLQAVLTNTTPTSTYRGAGRPEAMYIIERLVDTAAARLKLDPVELRRKNLIQPDMLPYRNAVGSRYDSGEFETNMMRALEMADRDGYAARREISRQRGKLRGFGFSNYIETASGFPQERAVITVLRDRVNIILGTQASGQGHETAFAQMITEWLGVPFETVHFLHGDTDIVLMGSGTHASRSMRLGGLLFQRAAETIIANGKALAARALQADLSDVSFSKGRFHVAGSGRSIGLFELTEVSADLAGPDGFGLEASAEITVSVQTYPNGCHVCEVEIDPETGAVVIDRYYAVDDVGRVINPMMVDGQTHGGIVQGIGQALFEDCVYDSTSGQLLSGSLMDYAIPRASDCPCFNLENNEVLAPNNPLGIKGAGEGGTTGAPPAIINAIIDALREFGVEDIRMPATPARIWQAIAAGAATKPRPGEAAPAFAE